MQRNPIENLDDLVAYLSMNEMEKAVDLLYAHEWAVRHGTTVVENTLDDPSVPAGIKTEIKTVVQDEDAHLGDMTEVAIQAVADHLDVGECLGFIFEHYPEEAPTWASVTLRGRGVKHGWLVHASDEARTIASEGFRRGVTDLTQLALTTSLPDVVKQEPGYNFAHEPHSFKRYGLERGRPKYGRDLVVFQAPYALTWHEYDEEPQAIFWGPDATDIHRVYPTGEDYLIGLEDAEGIWKEYEFSTIEEVVEALEEEIGSR